MDLYQLCFCCSSSVSCSKRSWIRFATSTRRLLRSFRQSCVCVLGGGGHDSYTNMAIEADSLPIILRTVGGALPQPPPPSSLVSALEGLQCEPRRVPSSPSPSPCGSAPPLPASSPGNISPTQDLKWHLNNTKHVTVSHTDQFLSVLACCLVPGNIIDRDGEAYVELLTKTAIENFLSLKIRQCNHKLSLGTNCPPPPSPPALRP